MQPMEYNLKLEPSWRHKEMMPSFRKLELFHLQIHRGRYNGHCPYEDKTLHKTFHRNPTNYISLRTRADMLKRSL